jgi:hypothetical protein
MSLRFTLLGHFVLVSGDIFFIFDLLYDVISSSDYIVSNVRKTGDKLTGKD